MHQFELFRVPDLDLGVVRADGEVVSVLQPTDRRDVVVLQQMPLIVIGTAQWSAWYGTWWISTASTVLVSSMIWPESAFHR